MDNGIAILLLLLLCGGVSIGSSHHSPQTRSDHIFIYVPTGERVFVEAYSDQAVARFVMIYAARLPDGTTLNVRSDDLEIP